ncbi:MAG: hypothetical protein ACP5RQ_02625 [Candidatus Micrarchaeia archaeon]
MFNKSYIGYGNVIQKEDKELPEIKNLIISLFNHNYPQNPSSSTTVNLTFNRLENFLNEHENRENNYTMIVVESIQSIMQYLGYTNKKRDFIESISDTNFINNKNYKEYIENIILFNKNLHENNEFFYFIENMSDVGFLNYLKILNIKNIKDMKYNGISIIFNTDFLNTISPIFNNSNFDKTIDNIEDYNKSDLDLKFKVFFRILEVSKEKDIIEYYDALKYINYRNISDDNKFKDIKNILIENSLNIDLKNIIIVSSLYSKEDFLPFLKYLESKKIKDATNEFIDSFKIALNENTIDAPYNYIITKYKELGRKFDNVAKSSGSIVNSFIILSKIYENKSNDYKELNYLIKKYDAKKLKEFEKNLTVVYKNRSQISEILNYLKKEYENIYDKNIVRLLNKMGILLKLAYEDKIIYEYKINEIISNCNLKIKEAYEINNSTNRDINNNVNDKYNIETLLKDLDKYASNTSKYIERHLKSEVSIFNKPDIKEELIKQILYYLKLKKSDIAINPDEINSVKIEEKENKKNEIKKKYEAQFIKDFEKKIKIAQIKFKNNKIEELTRSFDIPKLILSNILKKDIDTDSLNLQNPYFLNVLYGLANGINKYGFDGRDKSIEVNEKILKNIIEIYYNKGNEGALEYLDNMPENKKLKEIMKERGTDIEALKHFEYRSEIPLNKSKIDEINNTLRTEEEIIFYVSNDVMKNLNLGVEPLSTCLNIINGDYPYASVPRAVDANNFIVYITVISSNNNKIEKKDVGRISLLESDIGILINSNLYIEKEYKNKISKDIIIDFMKELANKSNRRIICETGILNTYQQPDLNKSKDNLIYDPQVSYVKNLEVESNYGECQIIYSDIFAGIKNKRDEKDRVLKTTLTSAYCFEPKR